MRQSIFIKSKKVFIYVAGLWAIGITITGCKSSNNASSSKTGWAYNNKYNGGFEVAAKVEPGIGPGLVAIEGGTFVMGGSLNQDLSYDYDNIKRRVTVGSFYMDETEVANVDWREYLHWIKTNFPEDEEYYYNALPDTLVWRGPLSYNEPYVTNYFRHPAYNDYPVVGVTWEQANEYCEWRTDRVNEQILRDRGIMIDYKTLAEGGKGKSKGSSGQTASSAIAAKEPFNTDIYLNGQYKGEGIDGSKMIKDLRPVKAQNTVTPTNAKDSKSKEPVRPARLEDGILKQPYRLPTEAEWEYAALALIGNSSFENIEDSKVYTWSGMGVRSPQKATRGLIMANFKRGNGDNMGVAGYLNDKAAITAPVRSYSPNDFGLYNMAGNVNEWTADVYRKLTFEDMEDFNPFRGNQFVNKRTTKPLSGVYEKDKYGRPIKDPASSGKKQSYNDLVGKVDTSKSLSGIAGQPYNPDFRGHKDSVNQNLYGYVTLINDRSRVYKGGSWNDRAYWLNPATRRYMQQDQASAEVGFRCAMSMVGNSEIFSKGKPHFTNPPSKAAKKAK